MPNKTVSGPGRKYNRNDKPANTPEKRGRPDGKSPYAPVKRGRPDGKPSYAPEKRGRPDGKPPYSPVKRGRPDGKPPYSPEKRGRPDDKPKQEYEISAQANEIPEDLITGRNPVIEAIKSGRPLNKVFIQNPATDSQLRAIASMAKGNGVPVINVDKTWLDNLAQGAHQGAAAYASAKEYCDVQDILDAASERVENPLIIIANEILDTNNLGAILRSAEAAGAHGVIIPKRNAAGLTGAVAKASAGAIEYMRVARTSNIAAVLRDLKKQGIWIVGADASGDFLYTECDLSCAAAIVIGGESGGLGRLIADLCDYLVRIPMHGKINSLNASAAASVLLYEALRQRRKT